MFKKKKKTRENSDFLRRMYCEYILRFVSSEFSLHPKMRPNDMKWDMSAVTHNYLLYKLTYWWFVFHFARCTINPDENKANELKHHLKKTTTVNYLWENKVLLTTCIMIIYESKTIIRCRDIWGLDIRA